MHCVIDQSFVITYQANIGLQWHNETESTDNTPLHRSDRWLHFPTADTFTLWRICY